MVPSIRVRLVYFPLVWLLRGKSDRKRPEKVEPETLAPVPAGGIPKSGDSTRPVNLLFQNKRQGAVKLVWIDPDGGRAEYGAIDGASQRLVRTFAGHLWLVLDAAGKELGCVRAGENPATVLVD